MWRRVHALLLPMGLLAVVCTVWGLIHAHRYYIHVCMSFILAMASRVHIEFGFDMGKSESKTSDNIVWSRTAFAFHKENRFALLLLLRLLLLLVPLTPTLFATM